MSGFCENQLERKPDSVRRKLIESATGANIAGCWTCSSCDLECPVNIATNRLRPQVLVRLATLGFFDELSKRPEIWYCMNCRRCIEVCPNRVKPSTVIEFARDKIIRSDNTFRDAYQKYRRFFARFQRVRWRTVEICLKGELDGMPESRWVEWLHTPVPEFDQCIKVGKMEKATDLVAQTRINECFTCGECGSACPISCERAVFEPRSIIRMAALGLTDFLVKSPNIWLCLGCGRCSDACGQSVDGFRMIRELMDLAERKQIVDKSFYVRVKRANRLIMTRFIDVSARLFGVPRC